MSTGGLVLVSQRSADGVSDQRPGPAGAHAVLDGHDDVVTAGVGDHVGVEGPDDAHVPDRHVVTVGGQDVGRLLGGFEHLSDGQDADGAGVAGSPRRTRRPRRPAPTWSGLT